MQGATRAAADLFEECARSVYSLALAMLRDRRTAGDLAVVVLDDALHGVHNRAALLLETHRRAALYLRYLRQRQAINETDPPNPAALDDLDPISALAWRLVAFRGYTFAEVAEHLGCCRSDVAQAIQASVAALHQRQSPG